MFYKTTNPNPEICTPVYSSETKCSMRIRYHLLIFDDK